VFHRRAYGFGWKYVGLAKLDIPLTVVNKRLVFTCRINEAWLSSVHVRNYLFRIDLYSTRKCTSHSLNVTNEVLLLLLSINLSRRYFRSNGHQNSQITLKLDQCLYCAFRMCTNYTDRFKPLVLVCEFLSTFKICCFFPDFRFPKIVFTWSQN